MKGWMQRLTPYAAAVAFAFAAFWLRAALGALAGGELPPFITFYPSVMIAALWGGAGPGCTVTAVAALLSCYYLVSPVGAFGVAASRDALSLVLFSGMGVIMSVVAELYRRSLGEVRRQRDTLQNAVQERTAALSDREERLRTLTVQAAGERDRLSAQLAGEALRRSEEQFRVLADTIPNLAWWANGDGYITWYNRRWYEYTGTTPEQMEGWGWQSVHNPETLPEVMARWQESLSSGTPFDMVFPLRGADGVFRPFLTRIIPVFEEGKVVRWFGTNTDITEAKETEAKLEELVRQRQFALDAAHVGWWNYDPVTRVATWDDRYREIFGVPGYQLPNEEILTRIIHPDDLPGLWARVERALDPHDPQEFATQYRIRRPDGALRWIEAYGMAIFEERDGQRTAKSFVGTVADITERKNADETVRASLAEKEVLLKEIHHRVKNNMQVISSLVSLQAVRSGDQTVREVLNEVSHRVRTMALVHEKLYQSADLAHIDFADYLTSLLSYIWRAHGSAASGIRLTQELERIDLSVDTAVPLGLVMNELASNAIKHAFRERGGGEVAVSLARLEEGRVRLVVADDGVGLPAGFDWRQADTLGLRLVHMLAGQLKAELNTLPGSGTRFEMVINA